jgi:peptidoglycan/LPS O-acetylase OafA/YrhL
MKSSGPRPYEGSVLLPAPCGLRLAMARLANIQILRACAALMVLVSHLGTDIKEICSNIFFSNDPSIIGLFFAILVDIKLK